MNVVTNRSGGAVTLAWTQNESWAVDEWRNEASCRSTDPDLFFPVGTTGDAISQIEAAKEVCRSCPVQYPCLEFALATNQDAGVWGAASEEERRVLRKQRLQAQRRAC